VNPVQVGFVITQHLIPHDGYILIKMSFADLFLMSSVIEVFI
jgi:hypothetical protein